MFVAAVVLEKCGAVMNSTTGGLMSPDMDEDGNYDYNADCRWTIYANENTMIELKIYSTDIEESNSCKYDFLKVGIYSIEIVKSTVVKKTNIQNHYAVMVSLK